jgi:glycosyltransferase involved in cell wall biosynthesis
MITTPHADDGFTRVGELRFLFVGPGYPGVPGATSGSGIGTYVRELAQGLIERGHHCHALAWSETGAYAEHEADGVMVHLVPRGHWPAIERWRPDACMMWRRGHAAAKLDRRYRFDWVEVQSDEGIDLAVQWRLQGRVILRVHTTLAQMCRYKEEPSDAWAWRFVERERRSFRLAERIIASSALHARELKTQFPELPPAEIVPLGCGCARPGWFADAPDADKPRFLVVGTFDRRKGTDRLRDVTARYAERFGPCELRLVSSTPRAALTEQFGLGRPYPPGVTVSYATGLSAAELADEYRRATAFLHLARYESFGYPLIEAAACGTPVVATATGIAPELLTGELKALLVDGGDPADCVRALRLAVTRRAELGPRLFDVYAGAFTRDHMTNRYLEVLGRWSRSTEGSSTSMAGVAP